MSLNISLPSQTEQRLRERARALGQDISRYVEELIDRDLKKPRTIAEAAEPFARAVEASGVTDEEFLDIINEAISASRRERRERNQ